MGVGTVMKASFAKSNAPFETATQCSAAPALIVNYIKSVGLKKWLARAKADSTQHALDWTTYTSVPQCYREQGGQDLAHLPIRELPVKYNESLLTPSRWTTDKQFQLTMDRITQTDLTRNRNLMLYQNGSSQEGIIKIISGAKQFIFVNLLALACDEGSENIVGLLEKRAAEGIDVRVNVNKNYSIANLGCLRRLRSAGIAVHKSATHSSYYVNDEKQLLIGSQSLAKMFLQADGFNNLDRDVMLYVEGPAATDAWRDFLDLWGPSHEKLSDSDLQKRVTVAIKDEVDSKLRGLASNDVTASSKGLCRFLTQKPMGQSRSIQRALTQMTQFSRQKITFSGVKLAFSKDSDPKPNATTVLNLLAERSLQGISVNYIGNGVGGGNGELTMALRELADSIAKHGLFMLAGWMHRLNQWDVLRTAHNHFITYFNFLVDSKATVWTYFQFLHYKVWSFDDEALFIGSSNLTDDSFERFNETGMLCFDKKLIYEWNRAQALDFINSTTYGAASFTTSPPTK